MALLTACAMPQATEAQVLYGSLVGNVNDSVGRRAFPGNIIPGDRISRAKTLISYWPLPNLAGETDNYFVQPVFRVNRWTLDSKVGARASVSSALESGLASENQGSP